MTKTTYLVVAGAIALVAFAIAQAAAGWGAIFVLAASMAWVAFATKRQRQSS